jgi:predicted component of type VI protein secretion system
VVGETVVAVGRTASVRVARSDAHASVMMEVLARFVQRETLHPQIELLMTPRAVRRCENQKTAIDVGWSHGMERDGWTQSEHNKTQRAAADRSILHTRYTI